MTGIIVFLGLLLMFSHQGCGKAAKEEPTQVVCDPFSGAGDRPSDRHGVGGLVYNFTSPQMERYNNVLNLQRNGSRLNALVYLSAINILPSRFNAGFPVAGGGRLRGPDGTTLTEYFSLHLQTIVKLTAKDEPGDYQFALLSDDGGIMRIRTDGDESTLINDDGTHAVSLKCAPKTVRFDPDTSLPIKIDYFQGPRDQIAVALLWRKVTDSADLADPACGLRGSDVFFDIGPIRTRPTATWNSFLKRGWKVLDSGNFLLPEGMDRNPC